MAGRPKTRVDLQRLADEPELGETVLRLMGEAVTMARICYVTGLSKYAIREWLESEPSRAERASRARAIAADELVDETLDIADACQPGDEQRAKLRVTTRQWAAERWNPAKYAQQKGLNVQLNIGSLHLSALKAKAAPQQVETVESRMLELSLEEQLAQL